MIASNPTYALSALPACRRAQEYAIEPAGASDWMQTGDAVCYATSMPWPGGAVPLLAVCHGGRPVSLQPNPLARGRRGLPALVQATIRDLYDGARCAEPLFDGRPYPWQGLAGVVRAWSSALRAGRNVGFLFPEGYSEVRQQQVTALRAWKGGRFYAYDGIVRITCTYDSKGRRATKKVESISTNPGTGERETIIILHQRFLYRGYLQIAACDLTNEASPKLWHILWDPTQNVATRPLAIQQDDTWYCYGWDLTKNICELFQSDGSIGAAYAYAPFGEVTATGAVAQPFQWSSEYHDTELGMVYYNYRHYNPTDGRWVGRDPIGEDGDRNLYGFINNGINLSFDRLGNDRAWNPIEENVIHAKVSVDHWVVENGKYKRKNVFIYGFGPIAYFEDTATIIWSIINVSACLVRTLGTVNKEISRKHLRGIQKKSSPCQDMSMVRKADAQVGIVISYNICFYNCQHWASEAFLYGMFDKRNKPCCNPDGTLFQDS